MLGVEKIPCTNVANNFGHYCILFCVAEVCYPSPSLQNTQCQCKGEDRKGSQGWLGFAAADYPCRMHLCRGFSITGGKVSGEMQAQQRLTLQICWHFAVRTAAEVLRLLQYIKLLLQILMLQVLSRQDSLAKAGAFLALK